MIRFTFLAIALSLVSLHADDSYNNSVKVERILQTQVDAAGRKIQYPQTGTPELTGVIVEIPVGASTGWHIHTMPCVAFVEKGEVTLEREDGTTTLVKAGQAFAEVVNLKHNGKNAGSVPVKIIMFVIGTKDTPIAVKQEFSPMRTPDKQAEQATTTVKPAAERPPHQP